MINNLKNALIKINYSEKRKQYAGNQLYPDEKQALIISISCILFVPIIAAITFLINWSGR